MPLLATHTEEMARIVGAAHVSTDPARLARYGVDGLHPAMVVEPASREEIAAIIRLAREHKLKLMPVGGGTRLGIGAIPEGVEVAVSLARLNRVVNYEPADLTVSVEAGVRLADFERQLAADRLFLPLDPPYAREGTIGGILATNATGPKRFAYGGPRDFTLGMVYVTGEGMIAKTGGRVVKNVAGYDLAKLLIGSYGTLGIITDIHFKLFPLPRESRTVIAQFREIEHAFAMRRAILRSALQPSAVDLIDGQAARILGRSPQLSSSHYSLLASVGGVEPVIDRSARELAQMAESSQAVSLTSVTGQEETVLWERIQEFVAALRAEAPGLTMIKASLPLAQLGPFVRRAEEIATRFEFPSATVARAASGIAYFSLLAGEPSEKVTERLAQAATEIIHAGTSLGGRITLLWCPPAVKGDVNVWGPLGDDLALMRKLKATFDPDRVLNPGRFLGGI